MKAVRKIAISVVALGVASWEAQAQLGQFSAGANLNGSGFYGGAQGCNVQQTGTISIPDPNKEDLENEQDNLTGFKDEMRQKESEKSALETRADDAEDEAIEHAGPNRGRVRGYISCQVKGESYSEPSYQGHTNEVSSLEVKPTRMPAGGSNPVASNQTPPSDDAPADRQVSYTPRTGHDFKQSEDREPEDKRCGPNPCADKHRNLGPICADALQKALDLRVAIEGLKRKIASLEKKIDRSDKRIKDLARSSKQQRQEIQKNVDRLTQEGGCVKCYLESLTTRSSSKSYGIGGSGITTTDVVLAGVSGVAGVLATMQQAQTNRDVRKSNGELGYYTGAQIAPISAGAPLFAQGIYGLQQAYSRGNYGCQQGIAGSGPYQGPTFQGGAFGYPPGYQATPLSGGAFLPGANPFAYQSGSPFSGLGAGPGSSFGFAGGVANGGSPFGYGNSFGVSPFSNGVFGSNLAANPFAGYGGPSSLIGGFGGGAVSPFSPAGGGNYGLAGYAPVGYGYGTYGYNPYSAGAGFSLGLGAGSGYNPLLSNPLGFGSLGSDQSRLLQGQLVTQNEAAGLNAEYSSLLNRYNLLSSGGGYLGGSSTGLLSAYGGGAYPYGAPTSVTNPYAGYYSSPLATGTSAFGNPFGR